ncbi:MAG: MFS transporter, partial [Actinomycetota bacterium]|nr:MFS transporter [Actinomycetota bacterium]
MRGLREHLSESLGALREVFATPNLRRLELALAGSIIGQWASAIALSVFAYREGGVSAVAIVGLVRMLPAAVAAPFAAVLGDRYPRERVMVVADLSRAAALALAAAASFTDAPAVAVYAVAGFVGIVSTAFRPAQAALLPSLAATPEQLTGANVASSTIESVGIFAGPALGGLLLAATDAGTVFAASAGLFLWSAFMIGRIESPAAPQRAAARAGALAAELLAGFRSVAGESRVRLLVGLMSAQTLVDGVLNVLIVVLALDLLETGDAGVGFLNSVIGVGGLLGALAALGLVARQRLASDFGLGIVLWGAPIALIGLWPNAHAALVLLALVGVGNTIVDVAGYTLLQRAVRDEVLARVFGVLESVILAAVAVGALIAAPLVSGLGARGALVVTGAFLPLLAALTWRRLRRIDASLVAPERELALLRAVPIFAPLPPPVLEQLASSLVPLRVAAGKEVFRQG